jgi:hypothetical protein
MLMIGVNVRDGKDLAPDYSWLLLLDIPPGGDYFSPFGVFLFSLQR